jgi:site-specific DNA-methyltransferase (adenine-specific)
MQLIHGDCLEKMRDIPDQSVDMVLTDPPYGTTACKWDSVIPFEPMWEQLKRIIKPKGAIVITSSQPFTSALIMSNVLMFKYCWVWDKNRTTGFLNAKSRPLKSHEDIIVFSDGSATSTSLTMAYNPQGLLDCNTIKTNFTTETMGERKSRANGSSWIQKKTNYPKSIISFKSDKTSLHPTQKPVALMKYLIKTYTLEGETVLDFTMGSGSTGVACVNLNRDFIGIEKDKKYFQISVDRIAQAQKDKAAMLDL